MLSGMPARRLRVEVADPVRAGIAAIRAEHDVPEAFAPDVEAEAAAAARRVAGGERADLRDVAFFTIDPPGSRDLDQAMALDRDGAGHRVRYAIADVAAFVAPGGLVDREAHARGATVYLPGDRAPLHPPVLSEGAASLLAGEDRPALVWDLRIDGDGELTDAALVPALVRSLEQLDYATAQERGDEPLRLLREVGERRIAIAAARGASRLAMPEQEVVCGPGGWTVAYRAPLPVEDWNAEISLLTGMAAAAIMLERGAGILRAQAAPSAEALALLRRKAGAAGTPWREGEGYAAWLARLDPADPAQAALIAEAAQAGEPARYVAFAGDAPADAAHFAIAAPYAHVTAPLRRLADRYALACCLPEPPPWALDGLAALPDEMAAAARRAGTVERAVVDLVEAVLLASRVGETFEAVVLDADDKGARVLLRDPAVRARATGTFTAGQIAQVRLTEADPATRTIRFTGV
jgi:exoribonuclease R